MNSIKGNICIGLGYGDEGKGITTDFLSSKSENSIVIRFSGGQQAGHTVMHNGIKHIHSNFGSGTLRGIPTYFSEHTTFYPVTIARELKILKEKGLDPRLILHPLAKMTTPYDVFDNRSDDSNLKHGTCGLGIGKTMKRNESPYKLYAVDLLNYDILCQKIDTIKNNYYGDKTRRSNYLLSERNEIDDFMDAIEELSWEIRDYDYLKNYDNLVFEGSQGILLDMDHGVFPNVTYANTTSKNAHEILDKIGIKNRSVYYVTRSYSTRHGSGPFMEEELSLINNEEEINVNNIYQKNFKVASINYDLLNYALSVDKIYWSTKNNISSHLVVTCMDQLEGFSMDYHKFDGTRVFSTIHESYSPDNKDFKKIWPQNETINK